LTSPIQSLSAVAFGNGVFAAVSDAEGSTLGAVSKDGVHW